jgi:hypothetical protein
MTTFNTAEIYGIIDQLRENAQCRGYIYNREWKRFGEMREWQFFNAEKTIEYVIQLGCCDDVKVNARSVKGLSANRDGKVEGWEIRIFYYPLINGRRIERKEWDPRFPDYDIQTRFTIGRYYKIKNPNNFWGNWTSTNFGIKYFTTSLEEATAALFSKRALKKYSQMAMNYLDEQETKLAARENS